MQVKKEYSGLIIEQLELANESSILYSSIKAAKQDVEVEDWQDVKDADDNSFFTTTFE